MFDFEYTQSQLVRARAWCDNEVSVSPTDLTADICRSLNSGAMTSLMTTCGGIDAQTILANPDVMQACSVVLPFRACLNEQTHLTELQGADLEAATLIAHMACGDAGLVGELRMRLEETSPKTQAPENGFRQKMVEIDAWCNRRPRAEETAATAAGPQAGPQDPILEACRLFQSTEPDSSVALMGVCQRMGESQEMQPPPEIEMMCRMNQSVVNYKQCLAGEGSDEAMCRAQFLVL